MKLLFLSNFYPPAGRGGYEQWCQEVLERLRDRGHDTIVLTSDHRKDKLPSPDPVWVHRDLHLEMELASFRNAIEFFTHRSRREQDNLNTVRAYIERFQPEAVLIWGMWNLQHSLPALIEGLLPGRVVYYMGDYWPTLPNQFENYWNAPPRNKITGFIKLLLKPYALRILTSEKRAELKLDHVLFPSMFMQEEFRRKGVEPRYARTVYGAIDTRLYLNEKRKQSGELCLLYIGRLVEEKGVHTAVEALGILAREHGLKDLHLTVVGNGDPEYETLLRQFVEGENIASFVDFQPAQPKEALPALYQQADIFLFTSIWPEPFGRVIVEAMASGLAVVGAPVGGAAEILIEGETALTFEPNNAHSLAEQIKRLIASSELRARLAKSGRETSVNQFDIQRMTTEIETYLESLACS